MTPTDDQSQQPWTDPQTHLDTDPVNAEPAPREASDKATDEATAEATDDEDGS